MSFQRNIATTWHDNIPGAHWFKSDLHIHTIDDLPGRRIKIPPCITGEKYSRKWMGDYARCFLQALIRSGVQVAGLTPHAVSVERNSRQSGVWSIIEEWNNGKDDDGVPFREKIFAIFPGVEPSLLAGRNGLHLLFLFDPEIGKEGYLRAFNLIMGGVSPWDDGNLRISSKRPEEVFEELAQFRQREQTEEEEWGYLILAPHIDSDNGLLSEQKSQVLQLFAHGEIAGLELGDSKLPKDTMANRPWLRNGMKKHRQAFFHASDAYDFDSIGNRFTWIKLGSPRIKALRQAFVANESRIRLGFKRAKSGELQCIANSPDVTSHRRPWLKELTVKGAASFFGRSEGRTQFRFSPDLTCIIGGSMTGKSTLLDGLRDRVGAPLPDDSTLCKNVEARAKKFSAGNAEVGYSCPGRDSTASFGEQWPAQFFAQGELQRLSQESGTVEEILSRLVPEAGEKIERLTQELDTVNYDLRELLEELNDLDEDLTESEQALEQAKNAKGALSVFSQAGIGRLHSAAEGRQAWEKAKDIASKLQSHLQTAINKYLETQHIPAITDTSLGPGDLDSVGAELRQQWQELDDAIKLVTKKNESWIIRVQDVVEKALEIEAELRIQITRELADQGYDATKLDEFAALNDSASQFPGLKAKYESICKKRSEAIEAFKKFRLERHEITTKLRNAFDLAINSLQGDFKDRIRVRRMEEGNLKELEDFLRELRQSGITRWWNELDGDRKPSSEKLLSLFQDDSLSDLNMSDAVQRTFRQNLAGSKQRELEALYCRDIYELEMQMDDQTFRPLANLSGGQRVSVLLALLLETGDDRPLVIDQPEDELDNQFLSNTVLPALKKLKGRRQVILATHNANIVVNGDADLVLRLKANANHGEVDRMGVIEESGIRDIIVSTVDGGEEAFRLRLRKYGF